MAMGDSVQQHPWCDARQTWLLRLLHWRANWRTNRRASRRTRCAPVGNGSTNAHTFTESPTSAVVSVSWLHTIMACSCHTGGATIAYRQDRRSAGAAAAAATAATATAGGKAAGAATAAAGATRGCESPAAGCRRNSDRRLAAVRPGLAPLKLLTVCRRHSAPLPPCCCHNARQQRLITTLQCAQNIHHLACHSRTSDCTAGGSRRWSAPCATPGAGM